jgi:hypothetical protein
MLRLGPIAAWENLRHNFVWQRSYPDNLSKSNSGQSKGVVMRTDESEDSGGSVLRDQARQHTHGVFSDKRFNLDTAASV